MGLAGNAIRTPNRRIAAFGLLVVALDQLTKFIVVQNLRKGDERVVVDGFFKFVHWGNTGAAWSLFSGSNGILTIVAIVALIGLYFSRHHFESRTLTGQIAFGLVFGGIIGNLIDRLLPTRHEVVDFLYFYLRRENGDLGFPAFNLADSAICIGVGLVFLLTFKNERKAGNAGENTRSTGGEGESQSVNRNSPEP